MSNKFTNIFIYVGLTCGVILLVNALKTALPVIVIGGIVYAAYRYITR